MVQNVAPNKISLLFRPKFSLVDHRLAMNYLVILAHTTSVSTSSKYVGDWGGTSARAIRSSPASSISSRCKIRIFQVYTQGYSLMRSSGVSNQDWYDPFWYFTMSPGGNFPMKSSLLGAEGSAEASYLGYEIGFSEGFCLEVWVPD